MPLIIDGYNLMHAAGILGHGVGPGSLERSRLALLNFVAESVEPTELAATTVVFDAQQAPPGLPRELSHRGLRVRFSTGYDNADELIEELILEHSAPRRLTVVSSDHRLHRAARRRKARAVDSDVWFAEILSDRQKRRAPRRAEVAKPPTPLATSEVEYWLARFTEPSAKPPTAGRAADERSAQRKPDERGATDRRTTRKRASDKRAAKPRAPKSPAAETPPAESAAPQGEEPIFPQEYLDKISDEFGE